MAQPSLKAKALRLLARREYAGAELESKLVAWLQAQTAGDEAKDIAALRIIQKQDVSKVIQEFQAKGWVSDERVVESFLHQKSPRLGGRRLQQALQAKGIDEQLVQNALQTLKETEFERALDVWQRKFNALPVDAASYQKQARFLAYRGFAPEVIRKVLAGRFQAEAQ